MSCREQACLFPTNLLYRNLYPPCFLPCRFVGANLIAGTGRKQSRGTAKIALKLSRNDFLEMKDIKSKILSNINIGSNYYKMSLEAPYIAKAAKPGQFVMVRCSDSTGPLLRRPFSIHRVKGQKGIEILYEVIGKGTEILSEKKKGEYIDTLGSLGNGFSFSSLVLRPSSFVFLIAGGIGVAPLIFLAEKLASSKSIVLIGAKTKKLILCEKDFKKIGAEVHVATDDGSYGYKGFISELFKDMLRRMTDDGRWTPVRRSLGEGGKDDGRWTRDEGRRTIYACGPELMLKAVSDICNKEKIPCEVSLETKMSCGFGACLSCAVKLKGESSYKLACKDGPVFNADKIIW